MKPRDNSRSPIRVLVVNESGFVREGLCRVIDRFRGIEVVASISCLHDLETLAQDLRANVALIDARLPGQDSLLATRQLCQSDVGTQVVILSVNPSLADIRQALQAGAIGFLLREAGISDLEIALRAAVDGEVFLCPTLLKRLSTAMASEDTSTTGADTVQNRYSNEEMLLKAQHLGILQQDH